MERQGQEQEVKGHVAESDVEEPKPEGGQDKQLQEFNEEMITESEKDAIIQRFRKWRVYEATVAQFAEDTDNDVEQNVQWFLEMLPVTHGQRQMIAPVLRRLKKEQNLRD